MFCQKCGAKNPENANNCSSCGQPLTTNAQQESFQQKHDIPRCTCCGYTGAWKVDSLFRPIDYVIGIILIFFGVVPGVVYFMTVGLIRSNKDRRAKICPECKARNLWTFFY